MRRILKRFDFEYRNSILLTPIIMVALLIFVFSCSFNNQYPKKNDIRGLAKLVSVTPLTNNREDEFGSSIYIEFFLIHFEYSIDGVNYEKTQRVENIDRYQSYLDKILALELESLDSLNIFYNVQRPEDAKVYLGER